ncbi:MAG TPA: type II toxin-antitoxin system VapC family toxin [Allosphingosinicella sp.]
MTIVLDASVALKLVTPEAGTAEAQALLDRDEERIAPDWMLTEVAAALVNKIRFEGLAVARAQTSLSALPAFVDRFVATAPVLSRAMDLAAELDHPLYDCIYLLIAMDENATVVTADDGLMRAAMRGGLTDRTERLEWR